MFFTAWYGIPVAVFITAIIVGPVGAVAAYIYRGKVEAERLALSRAANKAASKVADIGKVIAS